VRFARVLAAFLTRLPFVLTQRVRHRALQGRCPLTPVGKKDMARSRIIQIRVNNDEYDSLAQKGAAVGGMSRLLRDHLGKIQVRHRDDERQRLTALNRLNANLNMITRWVNIHKEAADAVQVQACLADIRREIARLLAAMDRR
jgi:hypothetical protein